MAKTSNKSDRTKVAKKGNENTQQAETMNLLRLIEDHLPISRSQWETVATEHAVSTYKTGCDDYEKLKRKLATLYNTNVPTGDPNCPDEVKAAKRIRYKLKEEMDLGGEIDGSDGSEDCIDVDSDDSDSDDDDENGNSEEGNNASPVVPSTISGSGSDSNKVGNLPDGVSKAMPDSIVGSVIQRHGKKNQIVGRRSSGSDAFSGSSLLRPIVSPSGSVASVSSSDFNIFSLSEELLGRKRELKQQLEHYDMNFAIRHGRMPVKAEK